MAQDTMRVSEAVRADARPSANQKVQQARGNSSNTGRAHTRRAPIPLDLPTVDKDDLISLAAYNGDTDRYSRLRRPKMIPGELICCLHGIDHNIMFAIWWSRQNQTWIEGGLLGAAICATFIMNNLPSRLRSQVLDLPYLIRYPTIAPSTTYRKLAKMAPTMDTQILKSIVAS